MGISRTLIAAAFLLPVACNGLRATLLASPLTERVKKAVASGKGSFDHAALDRLLAKHVTPAGRVRYAALAADRAELRGYLERVAVCDVGQLSRDDALAFLINAYNAYTLELILEHYPVASIRKLPGIDDPWKLPFCKVGGETVTLNFLEHDLLRARELFDEPRIHFAVNCASVGCPILRAGAYTGAAIEKQLDEAVRHCLADPRFFAPKGGEIGVTSILAWYGKDFTRKHESVATFLLPYVTGEARKLLEEKGDAVLTYLDYDWGLNDAAG